MLASVRARLAVWGGASWAFELLLTLAAALMVLTGPLLVFLRGEERLTRQRALSLASAVLFLATVLTFKRFFMLYDPRRNCPTANFFERLKWFASKHSTAHTATTRPRAEHVRGCAMRKLEDWIDGRWERGR